METITPSLAHVNKVSYAFRIQEEDITPLFFKMFLWDYSQSTAKLRLFAVKVNSLIKNKFGSIKIYNLKYMQGKRDMLFFSIFVKINFY